MSWRTLGLVIIVALGVAACHVAQPSLATKAPAAEREVRVEIELLELPTGAPEATRAQASDPTDELKKAQVSDRGGELTAQEQRRLLRAEHDDRGGKLTLELPSSASSPPPPPPPPPPPDETAAADRRRIEQATGESVGGRVEPASIQEAVARNQHRFARCLGSDAKLIMEATIAASGDVLDAHSRSSQPDDPKLRDCVVQVFKQLKLRPLATSHSARVKFALALKRTADH